MQSLARPAAMPPLPRGIAPAETPASAPLGLTSPNPSVRVLVVDDDPGIRRLVRRILDEAGGYAVITACDGTAALRATSAAMTDPACAIHLVLTDLDMPGGDGCELGRRLAARWPALPVIYMSGTTHGFARRARLSEDEHFVEKPFRPQTLLLKVCLVLRLAAQARASAAEVAWQHEPVS